MPDARERPGAGRAVVPLMCARTTVVHEFVAHRFPGLAAVVGALHQLPEPAAGLRGIQPMRISRRAFQMINLPAPKMGATDVPLFTPCVRCQDECALACANQ